MTNGNPVLDAIRRLAGYQAIDLNEAYRVLLGGQDDLDLAPVARRNALCELLRAHGYREEFVMQDGEDEAHLMWVRGPWPIDVAALEGRELERFTKF